jgi:hypothetical protein
LNGVQGDHRRFKSSLKFVNLKGKAMSARIFIFKMVIILFIAGFFGRGLMDRGILEADHFEFRRFWGFQRT